MAARSREGIEVGGWFSFYALWEYSEEFERMSYPSLWVEIEAHPVVSHDRDIPGDYLVGKLPTET